MKISRTWAMPNAATFSIKPIGDFVKRYLADSTVSIDPCCPRKRTQRHNLHSREENPAHPSTTKGRNMSTEPVLDYGMNLRLTVLAMDQPTAQKADSLNLLEDIMDESRSIDDIVEAFLNGTTPKVYQPKTP